MARIPSLAGIYRDTAGVTIRTDGYMTDEFREQVMTWLRSNDIAPEMIPEDNTFRIEDGTIAYTEWRRNDAGDLIRNLDGDGELARYVVTAPVVEPVPAEPWPTD